MGFGQGLSGLKGAAQKLDVIGNNIANAGTVGFKSSTVSFADVYASSRVGLGTQVAAVNQNFGIGTISNTGGQFDMAVDGDRGLFRVLDSSGQVMYSRNGEFSVDKEGYLVNPQGYYLTGYIGEGTEPERIRVPYGNIEPRATESVALQANFDANADVVPDEVDFDPLVPSSFTHSLPMTVYDSLGNSHQLTQYFVKGEATGDESAWTVHYLLDGEEVPGSERSLSFDTAGRLTDPAAPFELEIVLPAGESPAETLTLSINYEGSTQFGGDFTPDYLQDGYATGEYAALDFAADGSIVASYTNGETLHTGMITLAHFNNLQGLRPVGGNAWIETADSGPAILGTPGAMGFSAIKGQALEESNVDMGTELVNMIITQRVYQANAQTISTQNEILQTLINMR